MTALFDSHVHLDRGDAPERALREALPGLRGAILGGYDPRGAGRARALSARGPLWWTVGLHPWWLAEQDPGGRRIGLGALRDALEAGGAVGVGEIGLDRGIRGRLDLPAQLGWMRAGLELAADHGLPVVLHLPGWLGQGAGALRPFARPGLGVLHRFGGAPDQVGALVELGLSLSLGVQALGWPAGRLAALARAIPEGRLLLETDWAGGAGGYGRALEGLQRLTESVARARGVPWHELAGQVTDNAARLFGLEVGR